MYSKEIDALLKKNRIRTGEKVEIITSDNIYRGILLPQSEFGNKNAIALKAESGYNISIMMERGLNIKKAGSTAKELGKTKRSLLKLKFNPSKPAVSLISTGGTISSRVDYKTGGVYMFMTPEEFLYNIPELANIINIKSIINPFTKASEDMNHEDWQVIAKEAAKELNKSAKGVIVTHGTDTLHYTSAALSFMLQNLSKPVVLVGAQRSSDRASADTAFNLLCASHLAISNIAEVGICMHATIQDNYCIFSRGTKVRKMHSSRRDAFRPINEQPLAKVWPSGKIEIANNAYKKRNDGKVIADVKIEPKVAILKTYPNSEPKIIDFLRKEGYRGFVLEATGLGHVPTFAKKSWIDTIKKTINDGVPVVIATQTLYGSINTKVYTNLRILFQQAKALSAYDMLPETAFIKLSWVLGHTTNLEKVREMMLYNYAGEYSKRITSTSFLY